MTFEQFKYVLEVAKCGSFNQAANTMFLSQSTLSTSIKNLEEELGQSLFPAMVFVLSLLFAQNYISITALLVFIYIIMTELGMRPLSMSLISKLK